MTSGWWNINDGAERPSSLESNVCKFMYVRPATLLLMLYLTAIHITYRLKKEASLLVPFTAVVLCSVVSIRDGELARVADHLFLVLLAFSFLRERTRCTIAFEGLLAH